LHLIIDSKKNQQTFFMTFEQLGLSKELLKAIDKVGYTEPTPIQLKAIPVILNRKDILASAQTGTGKTAGFVLPILQILIAKPPVRRKVRSLILTPTRELAAQIYENIKSYSEFVDIKATVVFGGVNINPQISTLKNGVDIIVATPGRLLDLYQQKAVNLSEVEIFVLDEADRMLDMGFAKDIKRVLQIIPERRQNLLFSATFSFEIKQLASGILNDPETVEATPENTTAEKVDQRIIITDKDKKGDLLVKLIKEGDWHQVLVFTRTKHGANKLSEKLTKSGLKSSAIHGNKTQNARTKALDDFKKNEIRVLVATDIAARGLDIPLLPHVVNYELPNISEDYVHRIGRTGRAGASGEAVSIVCTEEFEYLRGIEKLLQLKFDKEQIAGFEQIDDDPNAPPPAQGKNQRPPNPNRPQNTSRPPSQGRPTVNSGGQSRPLSNSGGRPQSQGSSERRPQQNSSNNQSRPQGNNGAPASSRPPSQVRPAFNSSRPSSNAGPSGVPKREFRSNPTSSRPSSSNKPKREGGGYTDRYKGGNDFSY
jgi:ATP-dependent RNA helicase RhlE